MLHSVDFVPDPLPRRIRELLRQTFSPYGYQRRELVGPIRLMLLESQPQALLGQRPERGLVISRHPLRPLEEVVRNFDCRLHGMATHIKLE